MKQKFSFKKLKNYKIYSSDDNRHIVLSIVCYSLYIVGIIMLILYFIKFGNFRFELSDNHEHWVETFSILSGIMAVLGTGLLIINLRAGQKSVKKSNTLPVCIDIFKELRSADFLRNEATIDKYLSDTSKISTSDDEKILNDAIRSYLHIMNNISALVIHDIVDDEPIISYKGVDILYFYSLLEPYVLQNRVNLYNKVRKDSNVVDYESKQILLESSSLCYAHYELFVKQIKAKAPYLIKQFNERVNTF